MYIFMNILTAGTSKCSNVNEINFTECKTLICKIRLPSTKSSTNKQLVSKRLSATVVSNKPVGLFMASREFFDFERLVFETPIALKILLEVLCPGCRQSNLWVQIQFCVLLLYVVYSMKWTHRSWLHTRCKLPRDVVTMALWSRAIFTYFWFKKWRINSMAPKLIEFWFCFL